MTDLHGTALELETARVLMPEPKHDGDAFIQDGVVYVCWDLEGGDILPFAPLSSPAHAWEMHQWVRARDGNISYLYANDPEPPHKVVVRVDLDMISGHYRGLGPDDATALCRAVVEAGR